MKSSTLGFLLLFLVLAAPVYAQKDTEPDRLPFPHTDDRFDTMLQTHNKAATQTMDPVKLKREAQELLELSQALQTDITHVNQGMLPKDTIDRLKRIEKLCKRLRGEVGP
jgi:hypothetical protein